MKKISNNILLLLFALSSACVVCGQDYPLRDAKEFRVREGLGNIFGKLEAGKEVRIGYLGGSITAQAGWRPKTLKWFQEQYPNARISEINAAIGGTGSDLGVFRLGHDVLRHKPDLLFVEFAVNDGGASPHRIQQAIEGIVRQTYAADAETDICFVYTLVAGWTKTLRDGKFPRAASAMEAVADHYGIPSIHMGLEAAKMEGEGKLIFTAAKPKTDAEKAAIGDKIIFSPDSVHPYTDTGHELYLQAVVRGMEAIRKAGKPSMHVPGEPLAADNWQAAKMVTLDKANLSDGWQKLDASRHSLAKRFGNRMPDLYFTNQPGESITIRFKGTGLRIYDLLGPDCGQVLVKVDGKEGKIVPRFDAYCTYHRLATLTVAENLPEGVHTVNLQVHPDQPDKAKILAKRNQKIDDPKRYDDTAWYAGAILLIGEIVE
ncbi:MAG: GDSL-type esterase/lipase family protein [Sedimentisphaerales bacterium]|nr:GDSL-type esterase/lipase family protein [Sedimentisphaerales bacterium]